MSQGPYQPPAPGQGLPGGGGGFTPPPPVPQGVPDGPRPDGLGIAGLILAILGLIGAVVNLIGGLLGTCCVICTVGSTFIAIAAAVPAVAGLVMGVISMKRTRAWPRHYSGWGLALGASIVAGAALLLCLIEIVLPWLGLGLLTHSGAIHTGARPITTPITLP